MAGGGDDDDDDDEDSEEAPGPGGIVGDVLGKSNRVLSYLKYFNALKS